MSAKLIFWIIGLVLIVLGLVLAKVVSGNYADNVTLQLVFYFLGVIIALGGLVVILAGIRKRE